MSGAVPECDLEVAENCALDVTLTLQDAEGTAIDITGYTLKAHVRASVDDTATLSLDIAPTIYNATAGQVRLLVDETDSDLVALAVGGYFWDLHGTDASGVRHALVKGRFTKTASVTAV